MTCEYCGKELGKFDIRFHDECYPLAVNAALAKKPGLGHYAKDEKGRPISWEDIRIRPRRGNNG